MDPYRQPGPEVQLPGLLSRIYAWGTVHWRSSIGVLGVAGEVAAQLQAHQHLGPSWFAYGHLLFLLFCSAGFISAADAKKVTDLETALAAAKLSAARALAPPEMARPPAPNASPPPVA